MHYLISCRVHVDPVVALLAGCRYKASVYIRRKLEAIEQNAAPCFDDRKVRVTGRPQLGWLVCVRVNLHISRGKPPGIPFAHGLAGVDFRVYWCCAGNRSRSTPAAAPPAQGFECVHVSGKYPLSFYTRCLEFPSDAAQSSMGSQQQRTMLLAHNAPNVYDASPTR